MSLLELNTRRNPIGLTSNDPLWVTTRYASSSCCFGVELSEGLTGLYEQVYGKPGGSLNYDELVVYDDHAIRPAYLVMYQ